MNKKSAMISALFILLFYLSIIAVHNSGTTPKTLYHFESGSPLSAGIRYWSLDQHEEITGKALDVCKWNNDNAKERVVVSNFFTDYIDIAEFFARYECIFKECDYKIQVQNATATSWFNHYPLPMQQPTDNIATHGFHFDNLFTYDNIVQRWKDLKDWVNQEGQKQLNSSFDMNYWLSLMGLVLHAVQDFYCHSNWVLLTSYYGTQTKSLSSDSIPTWEEFKDNEWKKSHHFKFESALQKFKKSNDAPVSEELDGQVGNYMPLGGLQTGNWLNLAGDLWQIEHGIEPWGHRHPKDYDPFDNTDRFKRIDGLFHDSYPDDNASELEKNAGEMLSIRASVWWIKFLGSKEVIGEDNSKDLAKYVTKIEYKILTDSTYNISKTKEEFERSYSH